MFTINDALFEIRHVTILVSGSSRLNQRCQPVGNWIYIEKLVDKLIRKMPHLTTIRVAQRSEPNVFARSPEELARSMSFTQPPEHVSGFSLAQRAEAYWMNGGVWTTITQMGCYTYQVKDSAEDCSTKHFWTPKQIMEAWPNTLPRPKGFPYKLEEWREKRGFAEAKTWF